MDDVIEWIDRLELVDSLAVMAFRGWNDAGEAATTAAELVRDQSGARLLGIVDFDEFIDHQVNRPHVFVDDSGTRALEWPDTRIYGVAAQPRNLVIVIGEEPSLRWKEFCRVIANASRSLNVTEVITMGAFLGEVAHNLDVPVIGVADPDTRERHGLLPSNYEGPTGIVGVLNHWFAREGLAAESLWAACPHYLASTANPKAAQALVAKLTSLTGISIAADALDSDVRAWEAQIEQAVSDNEELEEYVRQLQDTIEEASLGGGDSRNLVGEIEDFLRDQ